jgi:release factor glutamine methyltransferase
MPHYLPSLGLMIDIKQALDVAITQLIQYSSSARLDAEILLAFILAKNRSYLYAHAELLISKEQWHHFQLLIDRRSLGIPIAYLVGSREFWSLPLKVCEETLIPRPETELLVELTLTLMSDKKQAHVLDLGTGSGAIAIALANERMNWCITASDYSQAALQIAQENAKNLALYNISFHQSDWFSNIKTPVYFDAIVSNPPYVAANDPHLNEGDARFEPPLALIGGVTGLSALEHIIYSSLARLIPKGLLLIEHGFDQKIAVTAMLHDYGYIDIQCWQDLHGKDRVSVGRQRSS